MRLLLYQTTIKPQLTTWSQVYLCFENLILLCGSFYSATSRQCPLGEHMTLSMHFNERIYGNSLLPTSNGTVSYAQKQGLPLPEVMEQIFLCSMIFNSAKGPMGQSLFKDETAVALIPTAMNYLGLSFLICKVGHSKN